MSGRHAGSGLSRLRLAFLGAREIFAFAALGLVAPVALLVTIPQLFETGQQMPGAPTCTPGGAESGCFVATEITVADTTRTWFGHTASIDGATLDFPGDQPFLDDREEVVLLRWDDRAVAVRRADGTIVESLDWGPMYGIDTRPLLWAPAWSLGAAALAGLAFRRRHPLKVTVFVVCALGTSLAGPLAWIGLHLAGYDGLLLGGLGALGATLIVSGVTLAEGRRRARRRGVRRAAAQVRMPAQRVSRQPDEAPATESSPAPAP